MSEEFNVRDSFESRKRSSVRLLREAFDNRKSDRITGSQLILDEDVSKAKSIGDKVNKTKNTNREDKIVNWTHPPEDVNEYWTEDRHFYVFIVTEACKLVGISGDRLKKVTGQTTKEEFGHSIEYLSEEGIHEKFGVAFYNVKFPDGQTYLGFKGLYSAAGKTSVHLYIASNLLPEHSSWDEMVSGK